MMRQNLILALISIVAVVAQAYSSKPQHELKHCRNPDSHYARIENFTVQWFQNNIISEVKNNPRYKDRGPIAPFHNALFYTRGMSEPAKAFACATRLITIWEPWHPSLYNASKHPSNPYSCIHHDSATRNAFFERMSEAFATKASGEVQVMHDPADYDRPPMDGIWGRIEQKVLIRTRPKRGYVKKIGKVSGDDQSTVLAIWDDVKGWLVKYLPAHFAGQMELRRKLRRRGDSARVRMGHDKKDAGAACPHLPKYTLHVDW